MISGQSVSGIIDRSTKFATVGDPAYETGVVQAMLLVSLPVPLGARALTRRTQRWLFER